MYLDFAGEMKKKTMEYKSVGENEYNWRAHFGHQKTGNVTRGHGNKRTSGDHLNYFIVEIRKNTEESSGDLQSLTVYQTSVENYLLMLV